MYPTRRPQDPEGPQHAGCHVCHASLDSLPRRTEGLRSRGGGSPVPRSRCLPTGNPFVAPPPTQTPLAKGPSRHNPPTKTPAPGSASPILHRPGALPSSTPTAGDHDDRRGHRTPPGRDRDHLPTITTRRLHILGLPPWGGPRLSSHDRPRAQEDTLRNSGLAFTAQRG